MKIVVLNGSPKGENSNTIHYMKYIMKHRAGHEYTIVEIGRDIRKIEKEPERLAAIVGEIRAADGVIWSFPVYHFTAPSQLMRFVELVFRAGEVDDFPDKYATAITTSVHFYDHLAHHYIRAASEDAGMRYIEGFSADMQDLQKPEWRRRLLLFFDRFTDSIEGRAPVEKRYALPPPTGMKEYAPAGLTPPVSIGDRRIVLVTDAGKGDVNLCRMVDVFRRSVDGRVDVVDLNEIDIGGGCLGCMRCAEGNVCVYKDGLRSVYYEMIAGADAIVYAGRIRGRTLSSRWKMFFDRSFVNGHCPLMAGGQYGYIVSGPLRLLPDLREELEARAQMGGNMAGIVTDEYDDPERITALVQQLAKDLARGMETGYLLPPTYLAVGGHLIFRDLVYRIGWIARADDRYYKKHGLFDYPQKEYGSRMQRFILRILMNSGRFRKMIFSKVSEANAGFYQKIIDTSQ